MRRSIRLLTALLCIAVAAVTLLPACSGKSPSRPSLAVSIAPQKYLLENIVGKKYDIFTLLPPNSDPETYDPSVNSMTGMQKSCIFFRLGTIGFEQAILGKVAENFPDLKIVNSSAGIPLVSGTHAGPGGFDPHVWTSVRNARIIVRNMYLAMLQQDPSQKKNLTRRYQRFDAELAALDSTIRVMLAPCKGAAFVIRHPSLSYFAKDYGLRQLSLETEGKEPSPGQMRERLDSIKKAGAKVFFIEKGHPNASLINLAEEMGIPVAEISLLDYDWKENMLTLARAVAANAADEPGESD